MVLYWWKRFKGLNKKEKKKKNTKKLAGDFDATLYASLPNKAGTLQVAMICL